MENAGGKHTNKKIGVEKWRIPFLAVCPYCHVYTLHTLYVLILNIYILKDIPIRNTNPQQIEHNIVTNKNQFPKQNYSSRDCNPLFVRIGVGLARVRRKWCSVRVQMDIGRMCVNGRRGCVDDDFIGHCWIVDVSGPIHNGFEWNYCQCNANGCVVRNLYW